jgi:hypothetical protein
METSSMRRALAALQPLDEPRSGIEHLRSRGHGCTITSRIDHEHMAKVMVAKAAQRMARCTPGDHEGVGPALISHTRSVSQWHTKKL